MRLLEAYESNDVCTFITAFMVRDRQTIRTDLQI